MFRTLSFFLLQNFLRCQNNKNNHNLVCETLQFLDCICGSTTGGLGLLGLYINQHNVALINQTVESLTEYCQGPCHDNQASTQTLTRSRFLPFFPLFCRYNLSIAHKHTYHIECALLCLFLQNCIATHESNGIDIIIALILNDINPLGRKRMDLVLELKVHHLTLNWQSNNFLIS